MPETSISAGELSVQAPDPAAASRLCAACGMCCDGTMFHDVRLQESDDPKDLLELGFKLRRKKRRYLFQQPCQAFRGSCCSIYDDRPERCRVFECKVLVRMKRGELAEADAFRVVEQARGQQAAVQTLLARGGVVDAKRPFALRCERILNELECRSYEPEVKLLRRKLKAEIEAFETLLDSEFRNPVPAE